MKFLLDTNICSAHLRRPAQLAHRFFQHVGQLAIPTVVLGELYSGAANSSQPAKLYALIDELVQEMAILDFDTTCAKTFGQVRGKLLQEGRPGNVVDLMIGSTALVFDLTLVTRNTSDFSPIPGLRIENWLDRN